LTSPPEGERKFKAVRALVFDVFGTVVDWRSGIAQAAARQGLPGERFADAWRARYAPSMDAVRRGQLPWMNLDALHRRSLDELLQEFDAGHLGEQEREELVFAWHRLPPWPDAPEGLERLRSRYLLATLSNGGVALLTNLAKQAGLRFDCILSSELFKHYKPDPEVYRGAAELLSLKVQEVALVAAHFNDLRAAQRCGLQAVFVERPDEFGDDGSPDRLPDEQSDATARDFLDLAAALGC
jgi:2-haloacid dehalogenase